MRFPEYVAVEIEKNSVRLCQDWLARLQPLLNVDSADVFPSDRLLDRIPEILQQIATYLRPDVADEVQTASAVTEKARELGYFRFDQGASTHQILREYEVLAEILEEEIERAEGHAPIAPTRDDIRVLLQRLHRMIRVLLQASVDAFTERYSDMIESQQTQLRSFNEAIAHEIRSPLNTLQLSSDLLGEDMSEEGIARVSELIRDAVARVAATVTSLERLSRVDGPTQTPSRQRVDVSAVAADVATQLAEMASERGVEVRISPDLPEIETDLHLLEMILMNLIANAIKYSDGDKSDSFVSVLATSENEEQVQLTVTDNGLGIPRDQQEAVFARHFRGRASDDAELGTSGSGLGLSIVKECLEALDGRISLESEDGVGSTFTVSLPLGRGER